MIGSFLNTPLNTYPGLRTLHKFHSVFTEGVTRNFPAKKALLKISQNSHETPVPESLF